MVVVQKTLVEGEGVLKKLDNSIFIRGGPEDDINGAGGGAKLVKQSETQKLRGGGGIFPAYRY